MEEVELIIWGLVILVLLLIATIVGVIVYSGAFYSIVVGTGKPPIGTVTVSYKFNKGSYSEAGNLFNEVISIAPKLRCFGCYYDNDPKEVDSSEKRYIVGSILCDADDTPDKTILSDFKKFGYKTFTFPAVTHAVTTTFPYTTMLSIFIAISRVYPRFASYLEEKKLCAHPCIEIYDGFTIYYMAPLSKQDEFYVPEAKPGEIDEDASVTTGRDDKKEDLEDSTSPEDGATVHSGEDLLGAQAKDSSDGSSGSSFEEIEDDEIPDK